MKLDPKQGEEKDTPRQLLGKFFNQRGERER